MHSGKGQFYDMVNLVYKAKYLKDSKPEVVQFDLSKLQFLRPEHIVILACVFEELHKSGIKVDLINLSKRVHKYLKDIRLDEYWRQGFDRDSYTKTKNSTTLCLWHISRGMINQYAQFAKEYYERFFFKGKDLDAIHIYLSEVFNNIFDHSKSEIDGYVITQYYPATYKLAISICDFGVGIATNINKYRLGLDKHVLVDDLAIAEAVKLGTTSKSTMGNKGLGLDTVKSIVNETNGTLKIISNRGYLLSLSNNPEPSLSILKKSFPGTLIIIEMDTRYFEDIETITGEVFDI